MSDEKFERLPLNPIEERRQKIEDKYGKNSYTARQLMPIIDYLIDRVEKPARLSSKYSMRDKFKAAVHLLDYALGENSDRAKMQDFSEEEKGALLEGELGKRVKNTVFFYEEADKDTKVSIKNFFRPDNLIRQCDNRFKEIYLIVKQQLGVQRVLEYNRFKLGAFANDIRDSLNEMRENYPDIYEEYIKKFPPVILKNFDDEIYNKSSEYTDEEEAFRSKNYFLPEIKKADEKFFPYERVLWTDVEILNQVVDQFPTYLQADPMDYIADVEDDVKFDDDKTHDFKW